MKERSTKRGDAVCYSVSNAVIKFHDRFRDYPVVQKNFDISL